MRMMMMLMPALVVGVLVCGSLVAEATSKGPTEAQKAKLGTCLACHDFSPAKARQVGPPLFGLVGAKPRSPGMPVKVWDKKTLDAFLTNPAKVKPGTLMPVSVTDPAQRAAIIEVLASLK